MPDGGIVSHITASQSCLCDFWETVMPVVIEDSYTLTDLLHSENNCFLATAVPLSRAGIGILMKRVPPQPPEEHSQLEGLLVLPGGCS